MLNVGEFLFEKENDAVVRLYGKAIVTPLHQSLFSEHLLVGIAPERGSNPRRVMDKTDF